jgi:hypothetical protein
MLDDLKKAMLQAGYVVFAIHEDPISPNVSVLVVFQNFYKGAHPSFWEVIDKFGISGSFGTQTKHQIKTNAIPHGVYFTFA